MNKTTANLGNSIQFPKTCPVCESHLAPRHFVKNYIKTLNFVDEISLFLIGKRREAPKIMLETRNVFMKLVYLL